MAAWDEMANPGTLFSEIEPPAEPDHALNILVHTHGFDTVEAALGRIKIQMAGPVPQVGQRDPDQRTSKGHRSSDVRRFSADSLSGRLLIQFSGVDAGDGLTDAEATNRVVGSVNRPGQTIGRWEGCRRRCSDLREAGYIADTGVERDDRIVWAITAQGAAAVEQLRLTGWSRSAS
jgi:hypothetical protein